MSDLHQEHLRGGQTTSAFKKQNYLSITGNDQYMSMITGTPSSYYQKNNQGPRCKVHTDLFILISRQLTVKCFTMIAVIFYMKKPHTHLSLPFLCLSDSGLY